MPRLRNQDGIGKGISRLRLKLPTSISISAPIYSHRPYKRVCTYIGFSLYRPLSLLSRSFSSSSSSSSHSFSSCTTSHTSSRMCARVRTRAKEDVIASHTMQRAYAVCCGRAKPHSFSAFCNSLLYDERFHAVYIAGITIFHVRTFLYTFRYISTRHNARR